MTQRVAAEHPAGYRNGRLHFEPKYKVLTTDCDVEAYTKEARGRIAVDADAVELDGEARADLHFLWRMEAAALGDMRAMLASWTGNEARITAFLATWAYERYWNARAARDLLEAVGEPTPELPPLEGLRPKLRHAYVENLLPIVAPVIGLVVREPATAGHMARMAVHEGALQVGYQALLPRLDGAARDVVAEIIDRRRTFIDFFRQEAVARIGRSSAERWSARVSLAWPWSSLRPDAVFHPDEGPRLRSLLREQRSRSALATSDAEIGHLLPGRPMPTMAAVRRSVRRKG